MYGTTWCGDCMVAKLIFDKMKVEYDFINIDDNSEAAKKVEEVNNGMRSVPTIIFPDGEVMVEPNVEELQKKLEIKE